MSISKAEKERYQNWLEGFKEKYFKGMLEEIKEFIKRLTDEQRLEILKDYCKYCGKNNSECICQKTIKK